MTLIAVIVLVLLLVILIGFAVGRRVGYTHGVQAGKALCQIELREQSLRKGVCPTCDRP